jgi:hypothetical protein
MDEQNPWYDRNHDGIVSIADALVLIQEHAAAAAEEEANGSHGQPPDAMIAGTSNGGSPATSASLELNPGNRKLNEIARDVFAASQTINNGDQPATNAAALIDNLPLSGNEKAFVQRKVQRNIELQADAAAGKHADRIASKLKERFAAAGFVDRPPVNTPQLVQKLALPSNIESALFQKLAEHYSEGLGISLYT